MEFFVEPSHTLTNSFKDFIVKNGVVATAVGLPIGFQSSTMAKSLVGDMVLPAIYKTVGQYLVKNVSKAAYANMRRIFPSEINFDNFLKEFITWCLVILAAFVIVELFVHRWGMDDAPQHVPPFVKVVPKTDEPLPSGAAAVPQRQ